MADSRNKHESVLIDRLASTTTSLRNLFYINLVLAGAVLYLIQQDPGFVSERIDRAVQAMTPVFKIAAYIKDNPPRFQDYRQKLNGVLKLIDEVSVSFKQIDQRIDAMPPAEAKAAREGFFKEFNETQRNFLEWVIDAHQRIESFLVFDKDLKAADFLRVAGFAGLFYPDYWLPLVESGRSLMIHVNDIFPGVLPNRQEVAASEFSMLSLQRYNGHVLKDEVLDELLSDLPTANKLYESLVVIDTFCRANGLGACSVQDVENWQEKQETKAPGELRAPGIEVKVTRDLIIPISPIVFLISSHLFIMLFYRRQMLRRQLSAELSEPVLDLVDESWVPINAGLKTGATGSM
jgi:hypothetical protein